MARRSLVLISTGGGALLVALVLLWRSTQSQAEVAQPTSVEPPPSAPAATPAPTTGAVPAARTGKPGAPGAPAPVVAKRGTSGPAPALPVAPVAEESDDPASNHDNLHFGGAQLRAQHAAVEPLVRACIDKAVAAGHKPTGTAMLTYVVAKHGDKYEIEDTSYDADGTTLDGDLLECLHQTAKAMTFVGLPRRSKGLVVTRRVAVEAGALTEYKHVTFSYLR